MSANIEQIKAMLERTGKTNKQKVDLDKERLQLEATYRQKNRSKFVFPKFLYARTTNNKTIDVSYVPQSLDAVEYIRGDSFRQEQTEEHPDNFTSFEWLVGRLMFRGCDLWGMTDGEDDNGVVTKLIKDRAAEMMGLLERELDPNAEPVDLEKEEFVGVAESPLKTFPRVNDFECGGSYRH